MPKKMDKDMTKALLSIPAHLWRVEAQALANIRTNGNRSELVRVLLKEEMARTAKAGKPGQPQSLSGAPARPVPKASKTTVKRRLKPFGQMFLRD